ncbi:hypothetical protein D7X94_03100 [Acutalibacter sp. 1XD8-33]|nr:hypothetical protein D7X94_03100 [Acutalibacter sp. 1XD8-33]
MRSIFLISKFRLLFEGTSFCCAKAQNFWMSVNLGVRCMQLDVMGEKPRKFYVGQLDRAKLARVKFWSSFFKSSQGVG